MQEQLDYIVRVVEKLDTKQDEMAATLLRNTITVETHEKRSTAMETRIVPIENHVALVNLCVKITIGLAGLATTVLALWAGIKAVL